MNAEKYNITSIFPTSIISANIDRDFTDIEKDFFQYHWENTSNSYGNKVSRDSYVLDDPKMLDLKSEIQNVLDFYTKQHLRIKDCDFYITQSWLNYTEKLEYHHEHFHSNSCFSGVLYVQADENYDSIEFLREDNRFFNYRTSDYNLYNSTSWTFPVKSGKIIIFPSHLGHRVPVNEKEHIRVSLAFNTFVKGHLGHKDSLTELKL